jgi:hypothetical protein
MLAGMLGRSLALAAIALVLAGTACSSAPPTPSPSQAIPANICVTDWGWCDLLPPAPIGYACGCLTAQNVPTRGIARFFPHTGTPSPYLRPHTTGLEPSVRP